MTRKILGLIILILGISLGITAQTPTPTPPNDDSDVVKISTTLIQIDVVVTDKKGNQVTDLKPEDFEIYDARFGFGKSRLGFAVYRSSQFEKEQFNAVRHPSE